MPDYRTARDVPFRVAGVAALECPVSLVGHEARLLVTLLGPMKFAVEATGAAMFGPNLMEWPAKVYDVALLLEAERNKVEVARFNAERRD